MSEHHDHDGDVQAPPGFKNFTLAFTCHCGAENARRVRVQDGTQKVQINCWSAYGGSCGELVEVWIS